MDLDEQRAAALLDQRTTTLATRPVDARAAHVGARPVAVTRSLIIWRIGDSLFGTDVGLVAAVIPFARCARVPTREAACLGVIGRAGRFYSVICMRRLLGLGAGDVEPGHLLLLRGGAPCLALAVDRALGRFDLAPASPGGGQALAFEGRLVAPFGLAELIVRLGDSSSAALPPESTPP